MVCLIPIQADRQYLADPRKPLRSITPSWAYTSRAQAAPPSGPSATSVATSRKEYSPPAPLPVSTQPPKPAYVPRQPPPIQVPPEEFPAARASTNGRILSQASTLRAPTGPRITVQRPVEPPRAPHAEAGPSRPRLPSHGDKRSLPVPLKDESVSAKSARGEDVQSIVRPSTQTGRSFPKTQDHSSSSGLEPLADGAAPAAKSLSLADRLGAVPSSKRPRADEATEKPKTLISRMGPPTDPPLAATPAAPLPSSNGAHRSLAERLGMGSAPSSASSPSDPQQIRGSASHTPQTATPTTPSGLAIRSTSTPAPTPPPVSIIGRSSSGLSIKNHAANSPVPVTPTPPPEDDEPVRKKGRGFEKKLEEDALVIEPVRSEKLELMDSLWNSNTRPGPRRILGRRK